MSAAVNSSARMPSKSKKSATPPFQGRPASPLSPTRHTRLQEKADLQNLNDRLACYIDRVRFLEGENSRLTREVQKSQEVVTRQVTDIKSMYDTELSEARKLLDETYREKAKLEIDTKRLWEENEELKKELARKSKDLTTAESTARVMETRAADLQLRHNQANADAKKALADLKQLEKERDKLKKQCDELRKHLEEESLARVDVENNNQTLREELSFRDQVHQKELTETRSRRQIEISEIDGRLAEKYEAKLQQALAELRDQYESQMASNREEIELLYEAKIKELQTAAARHSNAAGNAIDELRQIRTRVNTLSTRITELEQENGALQSRCRDLEKLLEHERLRHAEDLAALENDLRRMRDEMSNQLKEYQDLMDIKVSLDIEIAAYRKLLESEEARLNITPQGGAAAGTSGAAGGRATPVASDRSRPSTPSKRTTPTPSRGASLAKRKRTTYLEESHEESDYSVNNTTKGDIEIAECDPDGKFVRLHNKSTQDVSIGGWTLLRKAGTNETLFKFHRSVKIEADGAVTVWSADANQDHEPPQNIVMKGQRWVVSDTMTTTLYNTAGGEIATSERLVHSAGTSRHYWR